MKAVVIPTTAGRSDWAAQALASLDGVSWPVMVLDRYGYELGKLRWLTEHTDLTEILLLHDSVQVTDVGWIDDLLSQDGSTPLAAGYFMFLGKYETSLLRDVGIPQPTSKLDAVTFEFSWTSRYVKAARQAGTLTPPLFPQLADNPERAEVNGRTNMVLRCPGLVKFKGTWHVSMIQETD